MSQALTPKSEGALTQEQISLITSTIAKGATPDELKLFLYRARELGLDPLKPGQIYFIKYGAGPGTIVVGIEGFRAKAVRTGKLSGISRGALRDDKGRCIGAFAEVHRSDWAHPAREEVPLSEYNTGKGNWAKMPETMIKKVAEAAALRMAFPDDLGGVYTNEEMDQAEHGKGRVAPQQPEEGDGIETDRGYVVPSGKFAKRSLEEIDPKQLANYIQWMDDVEQEGKPLYPWQLDLRERGTNYLAAMENAPLAPEDGGE